MWSKLGKGFCLSRILSGFSFCLQSSNAQTVFSNLNTQKQADFQQPAKQVLWKTSMADDHLLTKDYYTPTAQLQLPAKIYKEYE